MTASELRLPARGKPEPRTGEPTTTSAFTSFDSDIAVRLVERAELTRAAVAGEIDLSTAPLMNEILTGCLARSPGTLDLDLGDVAFFDCSGLNALLHVRQRAADQGVALTVSQMSPPVIRILQLTGAHSLFSHEPGAEPRQRLVRPARQTE
ncbi:anti-anti-sigma factor [Actinacidiphila yanglinensis]|uniref:Anti-sigma factor antagonist n=1 Tax=Actinacidiphila yanglinensis TaxID=310779 RepID=A0A1H6ED81_9ACTN|nr:STAS domain-containing protein [Actinacidiphila yanglinensis]SEG95768.1 anti-anti-sigma factor [Actinacidiphila yanglinensis]